jgi:hypothetical protein
VTGELAAVGGRISAKMRAGVARTHRDRMLAELAEAYLAQDAGAADRPEPPGDLVPLIREVQGLRDKPDKKSADALAARLAAVGAHLRDHQVWTDGDAAPILERIARAQSELDEIEAELARLGPPRILKVVLVLLAAGIALKLVFWLMSGSGS